MYGLFVVFVLLEMLALYKLGLGYFKNFNNLIDSIILVLYLPVTILIFTEVLEEERYIANNI